MYYSIGDNENIDINIFDEIKSNCPLLEYPTSQNLENNNYLSISLKSEWGENIKVVNDDDCYFILNLKLNSYPFFDSFHIPIDIVIILENSILMNDNKDFIIDNIKNILYDLDEKDRVSIVTFNNTIKQEFTLQK